jgi:hypothetical protein
MPSLHQVVDRLFPTLMHFGAGPFWVAIQGDIGTPTPSSHDEEIFDGISLCFYRGCFECWVPGPGCSAVIVVGPGEVIFEALGLGPGVHLLDSRPINPNGVFFLGGSRSGEVSLVIVGPDGPAYSGPLEEGEFADMVRHKWDQVDTAASPTGRGLYIGADGAPSSPPPARGRAPAQPDAPHRRRPARRRRP